MTSLIEIWKYILQYNKLIKYLVYKSTSKGYFLKDEPKDILHQIYLKIIYKFDELDRITNPKNKIITITVNELKRQHVQNSRRLALLQDYFTEKKNEKKVSFLDGYILRELILNLLEELKKKKKHRAYKVISNLLLLKTKKQTATDMQLSPSQISHALNECKSLSSYKEIQKAFYG